MTDKVNINHLFEKAIEDIDCTNDAVDNAIKEIIKLERDSFSKAIQKSKTKEIKDIIINNYKTFNEN